MTITMLLIILIIVGLVSQAGCKQQQCDEILSLPDSELWKIIKPTVFQQMFILIIGSLSIAGLVLNLITWKIYPSFSTPVDIMFTINIAELLENSSMVASSAYYAANKSEVQIPSDFSGVCLSIGIFNIIGNLSSLVYNLVFCFVLAFSMKKALRGSLFNQKIYHILAICVIVVFSITLSLRDKVGRDFRGLCGFKIASNQSFAQFVLQLLICLSCIVCIIIFRQRVPKNSYFKKVSMFGYYVYYMGIFTFVQFFETIALAIGTLACRAGSDYSSTILQVSSTFQSCFSILLSYLLIFLRFSHPRLRINIAKLLPRKQPLLDADQEQEYDHDEQPWLGCLLESLKGSQIISFLSGILICLAEHEFKVLRGSQSKSYVASKHYIVNLNEETIDEYILTKISSRESVLVQKKLEGLRSLDYEVTVYAVQTFTYLISNERTLNIFHSLDLYENIGLIKKKSHLNGGKSGEFFFCSHDNQVILKTIRENEAHLYLELINDFRIYYEQNPHSLICKIFGLYKFTRKDVKEEPVYMILMKNLNPVNPSLTERVYDIKGSEFHRSTMNEKKITDQRKLRKYTLKDLDFKTLEGKLSIDNSRSLRFKDLLKKDAQFLGSLGVMDYSLLIIKRKGPATALESEFEVASTKEQDVLYDIGIIDYLESWTFRRKAERAFKKMITNKKVTVTSPELYSQRFTEKLEQIF